MHGYLVGLTLAGPVVCQPQWSRSSIRPQRTLYPLGICEGSLLFSRQIHRAHTLRKLLSMAILVRRSTLVCLVGLVEASSLELTARAWSSFSPAKRK